MKSEWRITSLGEICSISSSKRIFAKEYQTSGVPFYRGKEVIERHNGNAISTELFISPERYLAIKEKFGVPQPGDILLTSVGTLGIPWMVDNTEFYFKDGNITWIRAGKDVYSKYLYLWLNSNEAKTQIDTMCIGSTQKALTIEILNKFSIALPSIEEQKRICNTIYPIIEKIKINKKIRDNLEQQIRTLYENYFPYSVGDELPLGWSVKCLSEVTVPVKTKVHNKNYVVFSAVSSGQLQLSEDYFTKKVYSKSINNYITVEPFDFAYNPSRINIGSIGMNDFGYTGCVSPVYVVFRAESNYHNFVNCFTKSLRFREEVKLRASGSVRQSLNYNDLGQIKIVYPPFEPVEEFNHEYATRLKLMEHYRSEICKLETIRDTLLPKLISGELAISSIRL